MSRLRELCDKGHNLSETRRRNPTRGDSYCGVCKTEQNRRYNKNHPPKPRAQGKPKAWRGIKPIGRVGVRAVNLDGSCNRQEYARAYWLANKEKLSRGKRERRRRRPDMGRRADYRAMAVGLLYQRDGDSCGICGLPVRLDDASIDHIVEVAMGGQDTADNVRLAHLMCNMNRPKTALRRPRKEVANGSGSL